MASGAESLFDVEVTDLGRPLEDLVHLGLIVFGSDAPPEEKVLVQYGPCMQDNFAWALDPNTSCEQPGCDDPWGGPPITWTFEDGSMVPPFFDQSTRSHMPACQAGLAMCQGSGTFTHRGLQRALDNLMAYKANPPPQYPVNDGTQYINILITDGQYNGYSTDAQVQGALEGLFDEGVKTFVIGFGDKLNTPEAQQQLSNMASWGSGGTEDWFDADNQAELEGALAAIVDQIEFDKCCAFNDCSENPEPTTDEPDPDQGDFTGDGDGDSFDGSGSAETADGSGSETVDGSGSETVDGDGTADGPDNDGTADGPDNDGTADGPDNDGDGTADDWGESLGDDG
ncbi:MAG: VWA domain-containing protein, partial [Deltaproteobacteria bacterium]|nr:VWA domain-containing protein [Deltaproteobacteria bacterium]